MRVGIFSGDMGTSFLFEKVFSFGPQKSGPGKTQGRFETPTHRTQSEEQPATPTITQTALPPCVLEQNGKRGLSAITHHNSITQA